MGAQQAFGAVTAPANIVSWTASGRAFSDQPATPVGRAMRNGDTRILPTGIVMYLGGNGAARTATLYVGGSSLGVNVPASNGGQAVGGACSALGLVGGGGAAVQAGAYHSGSTYYGWNGLTGRNIRDNFGTIIQGNGELAGYYDWADSPAAPSTPNLSVNSSGQVTVIFGGGAAGTSPNGVGGTIDYVIEWATDAAFTTGLGSAANTTGTQVVSGLTPGLTYYFRVCARNVVTNLAGTTGPLSGVRSITIPSGMRYDNGSAWVDVLSWYYDDGVNWDPINEWFYDNGTAWVALQ